MFIYNFIEIALNKTKKVVTEMEAAPVVVGGIVGVSVGGPSVGVLVGGSSVGVLVGGASVGVLVGGASVGVLVGGASVGVLVGGVSVGGASVGVSVGGASVGASVIGPSSFLAKKSPGKSTFDETDTIAKTAIKIVKADFIFLDFFLDFSR